MLRTIKFFIFLIALTPLVVDTKVFFPYVEGKTFVIRLLLTLVWLLMGGYLVYSRDFSHKILQRLKTLIKNPIFISFGVFMLAIGISTLTAFFQFRAFLGDVERGEGFVGLLYLYSFFVLASLIFEKKDWITFFKLSLITGLVMFFDGIRELVGGNSRPGSLTGNPIYLAGYFLFTIYAGLVIFKESENKKFWKWFGLLMVPISLAGILITQTRGVMVGVVAGLIGLLVYLAIRNKDVKTNETSNSQKFGLLKKIDVRKFSIIAVLVLLAFGGLFFTTRKMDFWQKVPGLGRLAQFELSDANFRTRLISLGVSWDAINPANEGVKRFLFGWGPENFSIAYNKHYNPEYFRYETSWFDRAHNKLMDVMVMHGLLGLVSYLAIWFFIVLTIFKLSKKNIFLSGLSVFFAVSYFIQNLTVFESLPTYLAIYSFWGYLVSESVLNVDNHQKDFPKNNQENKESLTILMAAILLPIVFIILFVWATAVPYLQMRSYFNDKSEKIDVNAFITKTEKILSPYTYVQENIRTDLVRVSDYLVGQYGLKASNGGVAKLYEKSLSWLDELTQNEPYNPRYFLRLAQSYNELGRQLGNSDYLNKSEEYAQKALDLAPKRQDILFVMGYSMLLDERFDEAVKIYKKAYDADPQVPASNFYYGVALAASDPARYKESLVFLEYSVAHGFKGQDSGQIILSVYQTFAKEFRRQRDFEAYSKSIKQLVNLGGLEEGVANKSIEFAKMGRWQEAWPTK